MRKRLSHLMLFVRYTVPMRFLSAGIFFVLFFVVSIHTVNGAQVQLTSEKEMHFVQDTFYVPVRIHTQDECINAVRVVLAYNPEVLSVVEVSTGDSLLSLWTQTPHIERVEGKETGRVTFEGGIPGGYCGRVAGDPGQTNILAKLVVTGISQELAQGELVSTQIVVDPETAVYLHDGTGTKAEQTFSGIELVFTKNTESSQNIWLTDVKADAISPELFEITLVEGPSVGNNKHYIVFNTTDKQSGVDHYEILETDPDNFGFLTWVPRESYWVVGESPYVLRDQKLNSKIMVKAVDKNGNERIAEYTPPMSPFIELSNRFGGVLVGIAVLLLSVVLIVILTRKRRGVTAKKSEKDNVNTYE
jgi:hypothetical protein